MKHLIILLAGFCFLVWPYQSRSQNFLGLTSQNNGGFYSVYQNPARLADNKYAFQLHLITADVQLNNNYARYSAPFTMLDLIRGKNNRPLDPYDLEEIRNKKAKNATLSAELRGPALAVRVGEKTSLALMSRVRSGFQVTDASSRLLAIVRLGLADAGNLQNLDYLALYATQSENRFNLSSMAYSEWALSIGQVLVENDISRLSGGITVKRYFGKAAGYIQNQNLNYRLLPDSTSNAVYMQVDNFDASMGYTDLKREAFLSPGWLFGQNTNGGGWGWDVGLSYEFRRDGDEIPSFRLSASLTDMGQIRYKSPIVKNYNINAENRQITEEEWRGYSSPREGENQFSAFGRLLGEEFGVQEENNTGSFIMATPSALNISADLKVSEIFFLNATVIQGIKKADMPQLRQTSLWAVIPRFEVDKVGIAFPLIYQNSSIALGTGLRVGPLRLGSDNVLGLFSKEGRFKAQGVDVYAGVSLGINSKQK